MKKIFRNYTNTAFVLCLSALLAGCNLFTEPPVKKQHIENESVVRAGICLRPPFVVRNKQNELTGLDVELLKLYAESKNAKIDFMEYPLNEIVFAIRRGEVDVIAGGFTKSEISEWFLTPCAPHLNTGQRVIVNDELAPFITDRSQLDNSKITVYTVVDSPSAEMVSEIFPDAQAVSLKNVSECIDKVKKGKGNIFLMNARDAAIIIAEKHSGLSGVLGVLSDEVIVWGIRRKEDTRCRKFDDFILSLKKNGILEKIIDKTHADTINH